MNDLTIAALLTFLSVSSASSDEEICSAWESKIEPDMQIEESTFTYEAALESIKWSQELIAKRWDYVEYQALLNSMLLVRGWYLKKAALEAIDAKGNDAGSDLRVTAFCKFLTTEAAYND